MMDNATKILIEHKHALALKHHNAGRLGEAERLYRAVLTLAPTNAQAQHLLGVVRLQQGQGQQAVELIGAALRGLSKDAGAHNNYGLALLACSRREDAEAAFRRATRIAPAFADAYNNLGHLMFQRGEVVEAKIQCRKAVTHNPALAEAWWNLAEAEQRLKNTAAALEAYQTFVRLRPQDPNGYFKLGQALFGANQTQAALQAFQDGLAKDPGNLSIAGSAVGVLVACNMTDVALLLLDNVAAQYPEGAPHRLVLAYLRLFIPAVMDSDETIQFWRSHYREALHHLEALEGQLASPPGLMLSSFYLAYHDLPDGDLLRQQSKVFRQHLPLLNHVAPQVGQWTHPTQRGQKIRVGFLSEFFSGHTICKLTQGFVRQLDRSRFEVVVIHTAMSRHDHARSVIDGLADAVLEVSADYPQALQALGNLALDILFYADIGMTASTYFMAHARVAPVQVVAWGHPDTTGISTLDYFLSARPLETPESLADYSETVIRLSRLPCYYEPFAAPTQVPVRAAYGLPETATLYCCPQTLQKLHPHFDRVLAGILEQDPNGVLVFIEGQPKEWIQHIRQRWQQVSSHLAERVIVLPQQPLDRFMGLLAHSDVLLDPIYFGSGNTLYESMVYGTPIVTWPGRFARGRIVAAAYTQMGIPEVEAPVAHSAEDYVRIAVELGRQPERRAALRRRLQLAAAQGLYADQGVVQELETFFVAALAAAARGEKLPADWVSAVQTGDRQ